jgi:type II protein arginine methyltransferase
MIQILIFLALSLPTILPPPPIQSRWYSEPVRLLTIDAQVFSRNPKGYPVLSKAHQALIARFVRLRTPPWFLLCNVGPIPSITQPNGQNGISINASTFPTLAQSASHQALKDPTPHLSYMRNLQSKQSYLNALYRFGSGYQDFLQAPLQPLTVNLESITYEVFEKDPIKYAWYQRAITCALSDWQSQHKPPSNPDGRIVVAVVGAGRGPLVTRALNASKESGVPIDLWALEKNPNAFVLLQRHNNTIWEGRVNLVKSDMRTWRGPLREVNVERPSQLSPNQPTSPSATFTGSPDTDSSYLLATAAHKATPYKIDILISELLGSFGDNELSPECLDGVQHLLNPVHGISIPYNYTAFISPIGAPKLHADISNSMTPTNATAAQIPYVVMLNAVDHLSTTEDQQSSSANAADNAPTDLPRSPLSSHPIAPSSKPQHRTHQPSIIPSPPTPVIKPTWSFCHPNSLLPPPTSSPSNAHNTRYSHTVFPIPNRGTCHGLAGYFESILYSSQSHPQPHLNPHLSSSTPGKNKNIVELSTNPLTMPSKSPEMISWFPIYFPLQTPIYIPDNAQLGVSMWRKSDERKVWYEWMVEVYACLDTGAGGSGRGGGEDVGEAGSKEEGKSTGGRSGTRGGSRSKRGRMVKIGASELHSSEKEACLM